VLRKTVEEGGYASYKFYRVNAVAWVKKNLCGKFDRLNVEASCDLFVKHLRPHPRMWT
jgi:hypothetical protein